MARIAHDPYSYHTAALGSSDPTPGQVFDGNDELGRPAKFRFVKHVNAVTVVAGHAAQFTKTTLDEVSNDVSGGAVAIISVPAGIYLFPVPQDHWCYVLVEGYHSTALGDGSVAKGEAVMVKAADGQFDTATGAGVQVGVALEDDGGSPTVFKGLFRFL
jgi:hypothetical protein